MKLAELFEATGTPNSLTKHDLAAIQQAAENGNRVVADGKTIWAGAGNIMGVSNADARAEAKWAKSGDRFMQKVKTGKFEKIELQEYHNSSRLGGKYATYKTIMVKPMNESAESENYKDLQHAVLTVIKFDYDKGSVEASTKKALASNWLKNAAERLGFDEDDIKRIVKNVWNDFERAVKPKKEKQ